MKIRIKDISFEEAVKCANVRVYHPKSKERWETYIRNKEAELNILDATELYKHEFNCGSRISTVNLTPVEKWSLTNIRVCPHIAEIGD